MVANEDIASRVLMAEIDNGVAAVWHTIINTNSGGRWLANKISSFDLSNESVLAVLAEPALHGRSLAFQTLLRNRVSRGGLLTADSGLLKHGENKKGLRSRWYPETLKQRILSIVLLKSRITFVHGDGLDLLRRMRRNTNTAFFIDPPYTAGVRRVGERLYTHSEIDHEELFRLASRLSGHFLMTYSDSRAVRALAAEYDFQVRTVSMTNTHHKKKRELLIASDLSWLR
jgi:DNA adenine methylase